LRKGAAVIIEGSLSSYQKDGRNVLTVTAQKIQPLEWDNTRNDKDNATQGNTGASTAASEPPLDDDIPF
jgi:single-stranded DNA-binding protein